MQLLLFQVLLTSSEAVLSALPSPLLAEAQMLRDRAMSHYQARSLFGSSHRMNNRRNGLGFDRQTVMDRGVGVTIGRRAVSAIADSLRGKELEGEPLLDANALKALIRLLRLAQVFVVSCWKFCVVYERERLSKSWLIWSFCFALFWSASWERTSAETIAKPMRSQRYKGDTCPPFA